MRHHATHFGSYQDRRWFSFTQQRGPDADPAKGWRGECLAALVAQYEPLGELYVRNRVLGRIPQNCVSGGLWCC
jgi:hypothetical protein